MVYYNALNTILLHELIIGTSGGGDGTKKHCDWLGAKRDSYGPDPCVIHWTTRRGCTTSAITIPW